MKLPVSLFLREDHTDGAFSPTKYVWVDVADKLKEVGYVIRPKKVDKVC